MMRKKYVTKPQPRAPNQGCTCWARRAGHGARQAAPCPGSSPSGRGGAGAPRAPPPASSAGTRRTARGAGGPAPTPAGRSAPCGQGHGGLRPGTRPALLSQPHQEAGAHVWGMALTSRHKALRFNHVPPVTCQHRPGSSFPGVPTPTETVPHLPVRESQSPSVPPRSPLPAPRCPPGYGVGVGLGQDNQAPGPPGHRRGQSWPSRGR